MFTPRPSEAYGWHVATHTAGRLRIDKGGGSDDFASQLLYYPQQRVVIVWASNNLRQRWRRTLNGTLETIIFGDAGAPLPPPVVELPDSAFASSAGRYVVGADTLELRAAPGYLYAADNHLGVPTDVMFFPNGGGKFTGFDPQRGTLTGLRIDAAGEGQVEIELADGRRITGAR